ncbi:septin-2-like [Perca flavescens]|uniref:septin-2-like n=1 Tax=Perca flavescens TaxID=8167 RepID=UPI00106DEA87|nr:septin-2-like [Perca flavescens]
MAGNTSSKYDNVTCKVLIQSGSPAVYQLIPKRKIIGTLIINKENIRTVTRMTLGKKNPNKRNKTILLVGETGTGKSTLINALVNYAMGVEWEDDVWFKIVEEEKRSQSESQTSDVIVYQIFGFEGKPLPYSLTIIDTPGYGDTRGIEQDAIVSQCLLKLFHSEDGVHEINAVGLVMKASENRLTDRLKYILDSVISLFGKDIEKNIVALITHSDGRTPKNPLQALEAAKIKCAKNEKNQPVHFLFNNCQDEDRTEGIKALKHAHEITIEGINQFTKFLEKTAPQKMQKTVDVLNERNQLTICIQNLQDRIRSIELKQSIEKENQTLLKKHEQDIKDNKEYKINQKSVIKVKEPIDGGGSWWALGLNKNGALCCTTCEKTCHYPCKLVRQAILCEMIDFNDTCKSCGCHYSCHVKETWRYVEEEITSKVTVKAMKEKYEKGRAGFDKVKSLLETIEKEIDKLQKEKDQLLEESFQHVIKLKQIALKVDAVSTRDHLDFLIERMKDTVKKRKLEEMKSRADDNEGTTGAGNAKRQRTR